MADTLVKVIFGILIGIIVVLGLLNIMTDIFSSWFGSKGCGEAYGSLAGLDKSVNGILDGIFTETTALVFVEGRCSLIGFNRDSDSFTLRPDSCLDLSCLCLCKGDIDEKCNVYQQCFFYDIPGFIGDREIKDMKDQVFFQHMEKNPLIVSVFEEEDKMHITASNLTKSYPIEENEEKIIPLEIDPKISERIEEYETNINAAADQYALDPLLIKAVIAKESAGYYKAVSEKGAGGLMQLTKDTAEACGLSVPAYSGEAPCDKLHPENCNFLLDERFHADKNLACGSRVIRENLDRYNGDVALTLAAYNAGHKPRWDCDKENPGIEYCPVEIYGIPPFKETQDYVEIVQGYLETYRTLA